MGPKGMRGDDGNRGPRGDTGEQGLRGEKGDKGERGAPADVTTVIAEAHNLKHPDGLGFFGSEPVEQHHHIYDAAEGNEVNTLNQILRVLRSYGLIKYERDDGDGDGDGELDKLH